MTGAFLRSIPEAETAIIREHAKAMALAVQASEAQALLRLSPEARDANLLSAILQAALDGTVMALDDGITNESILNGLAIASARFIAQDFGHDMQLMGLVLDRLGDVTQDSAARIAKAMTPTTGMQ